MSVLGRRLKPRPAVGDLQETAARELSEARAGQTWPSALAVVGFFWRGRGEERGCCSGRCSGKRNFFRDAAKGLLQPTEPFRWAGPGPARSLSLPGLGMSTAAR